MPSELDPSAVINSTYADDIPGAGGVVVRAEEVLIVILVLVLWVAAIALFFNRWGKIRMLEPYQPKFQQQHRQSCVIIDQNPLPHRACSKFNIHCLDHPVCPLGASSEIARPRQNSVFVGSSASLLPETPRRAKSAVDLQSLIHAERRPVVAVVAENGDDDDPTPTEFARRNFLEAERPCQRDRRRSVCQFDRSDGFVARPLQRERGMSVCHFERTEAHCRPVQRDRGMSIFHFDRTDVLAARPLQRERDSSTYHFDRMDVLARPLQRDRGNSIIDRMDVRPAYLGRSLSREKRPSVGNFLDGRGEDSTTTTTTTRCGTTSRSPWPSASNFDRIETFERSRESVHEVAAMEPRPSGSSGYVERPASGDSTDCAIGYKATCV